MAHHDRRGSFHSPTNVWQINVCDDSFNTYHLDNALYKFTFIYFTLHPARFRDEFHNSALCNTNCIIIITIKAFLQTQSLLLPYIDQFATGRDAKYCERCVCLSISVSLTVCLYVHSHIFKNTNFLYMLHAVARYSSRGTLCTSAVVDYIYVMFSYNGANKRVSKTMRMFSRVRQVASPEAKPAVSDCILFQTSCLLTTVEVA